MPPANKQSSSSQVSARRAAEYLVEYIRRYRREHARFCAPSPDGSGYPPLNISPYLQASQLTCMLARDGYIIADFSEEPESSEGSWLSIDPDGVPRDAQSGLLPVIARATVRREVDENTTVIVDTYRVSLADLLARLTLGAFGPILTIPLPQRSDAFWKPLLIRTMGMKSLDGQHKRWINYLEMQGHIDLAAWDQRSLWMRVNVDVRRDFIYAAARVGETGGYIAVTGTVQGSAHDAEAPLDLVKTTRDRLNALGEAIDGLANLLRDHSGDREETFQRYLSDHPILLTVYGVPESKPRLRYPEGELSLTGKVYVEPDFIVRYPADGSYELVELERPNMELLTRRGEPRSTVSHAAFQIAEWMHYIRNHYELIRDRYPGISSEPLKRVVVSHSRENELSGQGLHQYLTLLRENYPGYKIVTYDILLEEARVAYTQLAGALPAD